MATSYFSNEADKVDYSPEKIAERALAGVEDYFRGIDFSSSRASASSQPKK